MVRSRSINPESCALVALSQLFDEPLAKTCLRIFDAGGDPNAVTKSVFDRLLAPLGVRQRLVFRRPEVFARWRRWKRGSWVVVVTGSGARTGHCVAMRGGKPLPGNRWVTFVPGRPRYQSLRVHAAWQIGT